MKTLLTIGSDTNTVKSRVEEVNHVSGVEVVGLVVSQAHDSYQMFVRKATSAKSASAARVTMSSENPKSIDDILTEKELIELLGIKKTALDDLRRSRKLPFCKINNTKRIYLVRDVLDFISSRRIILNAGSD